MFPVLVASVTRSGASATSTDIPCVTASTTGSVTGSANFPSSTPAAPSSPFEETSRRQFPALQVRLVSETGNLLSLRLVWSSWAACSALVVIWIVLILVLPWSALRRFAQCSPKHPSLITCVSSIGRWRSFCFMVKSPRLFMSPPPNLAVDPDCVLLLKGNIYGMKQASHIWKYRFHAVLTKLGDTGLEAECSLLLRLVASSVINRVTRGAWAWLCIMARQHPVH
jgi:hypothetical protein